MEFGQQESLRADRYLHWDDFRHRAADKDGLTKEEQWAAIRMGRAMRSQPTLAAGYARASHSPFSSLRKPSGCSRKSTSTAAAASVRERRCVREEASRHQIDSLMEEALTSSQLEGAVVTRSEAREMIRHQRRPRPNTNGW